MCLKKSKQLITCLALTIAIGISVGIGVSTDLTVSKSNNQITLLSLNNVAAQGEQAVTLCHVTTSCGSTNLSCSGTYSCSAGAGWARCDGYTWSC